MDDDVDLKELQNKPLVSENAKSKYLDDGFLKLAYSFGWQCTSGINICVLDEESIAIGAGTSIVILKLSSNQQIVLPIVCGAGIAHIILHPDCTQFAVAEKGRSGTIDIFAYPSLNMTTLLRCDNKSSYVCIDYNPSGSLLAALTSAPEFSIIVWYWKTESILLKAKAFPQEVKNVKFSNFIDGVLITGGVAHIKFWSISRTFTGLKLKGHIGKFGHMDISDIRSFVQLSDGKVVSSSDWGNLLVWDDNMIQIQISRISGRPCHEGIIYQISLEEGELYTVGSDGWIRVWDIESIEMIYPEEEQEICEIKPLGEIYVNPGADLRCIFISPGKLNKKIWYAQDAKGAMWKIDISLDITSKAPEIIKTFPGLKITGCDVCPVHHLFAISSKDGMVRVYSCMDNALVMSCQYDTPITSLLWGSKALDKEGGSLFLGFEDGVVRWIVIKEVRKSGAKKRDMLLHYTVKSHTAEVTCMKMNISATSLISCSLDGKVFFYYVRAGEMKPVGFVDVYHPIAWILWLDKVDLILVGNDNCFLAAVETTKNVAAKAGMTTYKLSDLYWCIIILKSVAPYENPSMTTPLLKESVDRRKSSEIQDLDSFDVEVKDSILEEHSSENKSNSEAVNNETELKNEKASLNSKGSEEKDKIHTAEEVSKDASKESGSTKGESEIETEEKEASLSNQSSEKDNRSCTMEEIYESSNEESVNIKCALYTGVLGKFWLCLETGNPGFIYEYNVTKDMISEKTMILDIHRQIKLPAPNSRTITCMQFSLQNYYLLAGQSDGILTIYALDRDDTGLHFSEYVSYAILDSEIGAITHLSFSFDGKFLVVVSKDGNILMFKINAPRYDHGKILPKITKLPSSNYLVITRDVDGKGESLEDTCKATLEIQLKKNLEKRRHHLTGQMTLLRSKLGKLNETNIVLPSHMQVCLDEYAVHKKIKERLEDEMRTSIQEIRKKFEYDIKFNIGLREKLEKEYKECIATMFLTVTSFLSEEKVHSYKIVNFPVERYMKVDYSDIETLKQSQLVSENKQEDSKTLDVFDTISLFKSSDIMQINDDVSKMNDNEIQEELEKHIGTYKLKTSSEYYPPPYIPMQSALKQIQLLQLNLRIYTMKKKFNDKFFEIEQGKKQLLTTLSNINAFTTFEANSIKLCDDARKQLIKTQTFVHSHVCNLGLSVCPWQIDNRFVTISAVVTETLPEKTGGSSLFQASFSWKTSKRYLSFSNKESLPADSRRVASQISKHALQLSGKLNIISKIREGYEEKNVYYKILKDIWAFDVELHFLRLYRCFMNFELKQAEIKRLIYMQELQIFKKYDEERNHLIAQCNAKHKQKAEIEMKAEKQLEIIRQQQNYLDSLYSEEEIINNSLPTIIGENNKNAKLLTKFFKKKVKWRQIEKYSRDGAHSDVNQDQEEEEEEDESDWSSDDDDNDDYDKEWDCKTCPPDCDDEIFESVSKLRQDRSFTEYKIKEIKQLIETHKKVHDVLEKKCKLIEESVIPLQNRLEGIQLMKQKELNGIHHIIYLQLGQIIRCVPSVPPDIDKCIIFLSKEKNILEKRVNTLTKQTSQNTQVSKDVQAREIELKRECHLLNRRVHKFKEIAKLRMLEKFGQVVDLEELKAIENPAWLIELKNKQKQQMWTHEKTMKRFREKLFQKEKVYVDVMKERAVNLQTLTALKAEWLNLHTSLSKRKKFTFQAKNLESSSDAF